MGQEAAAMRDRHSSSDKSSAKGNIETIKTAKWFISENSL